MAATASSSNRGAQQLIVTVVPDSGAGDLAGIAGGMIIKIVEGLYDFDYMIAATQ
jgi:hypothetical protein